LFFLADPNFPEAGLSADQVTLLRCLKTYGGFVGNYSGRPKIFVDSKCKDRIEASTMSFLRGRDMVFLDPSKN
jgi:hypothetical protein